MLCSGRSCPICRLLNTLPLWLWHADMFQLLLQTHVAHVVSMGFLTFVITFRLMLCYFCFTTSLLKITILLLSFLIFQHYLWSNFLFQFSKFELPHLSNIFYVNILCNVNINIKDFKFKSTISVLKMEYLL